MSPTRLLWSALVAGGLLAGSTLAAEDPLIQMVNSHFDLNSNGVLDSGEWSNGLDEAFRQMDRDGSGLLVSEDLQDLKGTLENEYGGLAATVVVGFIEKAVKGFDADQSGGVTSEEFTEGCGAIFKKLDANDDGEVNSEEIVGLATLE